MEITEMHLTVYVARDRRPDFGGNYGKLALYDDRDHTMVTSCIHTVGQAKALVKKHPNLEESLWFDRT